MVITPSFQVGDGGSIPLICSIQVPVSHSRAKLDTISVARSRMLEIIVLWCNGSTTVFGAVCLGSNPRGTTIKFGSLK